LGLQECPRVEIKEEIKGEINYGVRKDSKSTFGVGIPS